jgi:ubiquinone/menaquinone biosynthesis C-methylase UbiE
MTTQPKWQLDEAKQLTSEYTDLAEVSVYDARRTFTDIEAENEKIADNLKLGRDQTVLDMGTGTGEFALVAARHCAKVYAVDLSPAMLDRARQKAAAANLTNIEFHQAGCLTYRHQAGPVDAVVISFVLHQMPDVWKLIILKRMHGLLKEGGRLYVSDVVFSFPIEEYEAQFNGWIDWWNETVGPEMVPHAERHIREKYSTFGWIMEGLLTRAGFRIDKVDYDEIIAEYLCIKINAT